MQTIIIAELTAKDLGTRDIARANSTLGKQEIFIPLDKVMVRDGFNVRSDYGDIQALAYSILGNGQEVAGKVDVLADGTFLLTDGHRRFKALQLLAEMGDAPLFKAIVNDRKTTEEERILQMFTTQDNKPLADIEVCELFQRLTNLGWKQVDIAKKTGKDQNYVSRMLSLASENVQIKEHVKNGDISVSTALKLQKDIPATSKRIEAVNGAVKAKKEAGSTKAITADQITNRLNSWKEFKDYAIHAETNKMDACKSQCFAFLLTVMNNEATLEDIDRFFKC